MRHSLFFLRDHQKARGILIDSMYQSGSAHIPLHLGKLLKMINQPIHQCTRPVAMCWMNYHSGRFIDYQQIRIFVDDVQGNVFRNYLGIPWFLWKHDSDLIQWLNLVICFGRLAIDKHKAIVYGLLHFITGCESHFLGEEFVNTDRRLSFVYLDMVMFVKGCYFLVLKFLFGLLIHPVKIHGSSLTFPKFKHA